MRVAFAGTPAFAATVLEAVLAAGFPVPLVLTQPDRPRGRGLKLEPSAVKQRALVRGLPVMQPASLGTEAARAELLSRSIDVLAVAAYGLILPKAILGWPSRGCINVHASLLPRWRGAAPIQRALLAGDRESGATIMLMDEGLDTGPMLRIEKVPINARETAATLEARLAEAGARALVAPTPQPSDGVTYAAKVGKAEAIIDWRSPANAIDRQVRAFDPSPGASTALDGEMVKIRRAEGASIMLREAPPGTVLELNSRGIVVACGEGRLLVEEVQPSGGKRMHAAAFAAGRRLAPGARFAEGG
jgi:methionyl-tRNA formyltransferase